MYLTRALALIFALLACSLLALGEAHAQITVGISVDVEPPPLPVYDQPPIPEQGYMWVPGYWAWDDDTGYYWVPGTWVLPPEPTLLWTPGYWGWGDGIFVFHEGYWGPQIGFYGGVAYGFGYTGDGYAGGYWRDGAFFYNQSVNNVSNVSVTNVYNQTVVVNNTTNVSYNGGPSGTTAQPTAQQLAAANERHVPPTAAQVQNVQAAAKDPALSLNNNKGHPTVAATAHPAQFKGPSVVAAPPGKPVAAVEPQGHTVSSSNKPMSTPKKAAPANAPAAPGTASTTPSGTPPSSNKAMTTPKKGAPANAPATPGTASTTPSGTIPSVHEHKGTVSGVPTTNTSTATTTPNKKVSPEIQERTGAVGGTTPSSTPSTHAVTPPPAPRAATPPAAPRAATAPPARPPVPPAGAKPKCPPGQEKC
jgi:hypothetical protein